jgi:hypothetical protein
MNMKRISILCLLLAFGLFSSACFSFEQEIFLNPDGSGELFLYISMPDLPDEMMKAGPDLNKKAPADAMAEFKKEMLAGASALKVKEVKEIRQNGARGVLAVFQFRDIKDIGPAFASLGKSTMKEGDFKGNNEWTVRVDKLGGKSVFTGSLLFDMDDTKPAKPKAEEGKGEVSIDMKGLEDQLKPLFLGMIKMRFVLHAPSPISDTNADMVLQGNTAVWNCSMAAFAKGKKPIVMKATY